MVDSDKKNSDNQWPRRILSPTTYTNWITEVKNRKEWIKINRGMQKLMKKKIESLKDELNNIKYDGLDKVLTERQSLKRWRWFKLWMMILRITEY